MTDIQIIHSKRQLPRKRRDNSSPFRNLTIKLGRIFAIASLSFLILFGALSWRISHSPLSIPFAKGFIEGALQGESGSILNIKSAELIWMGWRQPLSVRLRSVSMKNPGGDPVAYLPEISVGFSIPHLFALQLVPKKAVLIDPKIVLVRSPGGAFSFSLSESSVFESDDDNKVFEDVSFLRDMQTIDVREADIIVQDQLRESTWNLVDVDAVLTREADGIGFSGRVPLGYASVGVAARLSETGNRVELTLSNLETEKVLKFLPTLSEGNRQFFNLFDVPVNGRLILDFSKIINDPIAGSQLQLKKFDFDLYGGPGVVRLSQFGYADHVVSMVELTGNVTQDQTASVHLKNLSMDFGALKTKIKGSLVGNKIDVDATLSDLKIDTLEKYWPSDLAKNPREWVTENLSKGDIVEGKLYYKGQVSSGVAGLRVEPQDIRGTLLYEGLTVKYMDGMPPVENVSGIAQFKNDRFDLNLNNGVLKGVSLKSGVVELTNLYDERPMADIDLFVEGPLEKVFSVINTPRLGYIDKLGIEQEKAAGFVNMSLNFKLPLLSNLPMQDVGIHVKGDVKKFSYKDFAKGYSISHGDLGLDLTGKGMKIMGPANINDVAVNVEWKEPFDNGESEISLTSKLRPEDLKALNLGAPEIFDGKVFADVFVSGNTKNMQAKINLDFENASLNLLGWKKQQKTPGRLFSTLRLKNNEVIKINNLTATSPGLEIQADAKRASNGWLMTNIRKANIGKTSLSGLVQRSPKGALDIALKGKQFDGAFLLEGMDGGDDVSFPPLSLKGNFERVSLAGSGQDVGGVDVEWVYDGEKSSKLIFGGTLASSKKVEVGIYPDSSGKGRSRRLWVYSDDAGAFLREVGLYENIMGGVISIAGFFDDVAKIPSLKGKLVVEDFRLVRAPTVMQLLNVASLHGAQDNLRGKGIKFDKMEAPFKKSGADVSFEDAVLNGPSIGFTAKGNYNSKSQNINLSGLLIPANTLNKVLGNIPLVGQVLTGFKKEGIIAVSYDVKGDVSSPKITVNPLTALVPGVIRDLFGGGS